MINLILSHALATRLAANKASREDMEILQNLAKNELDKREREEKNFKEFEERVDQSIRNWNAYIKTDEYKRIRDSYHK